MVKKSKLLLALDAHKGRDYKREYQKKLTNAADKRKKAKSEQSSGEQLGQTKKVWLINIGA
jgi:rRNA-processing protein EBP2